MRTYCNAVIQEQKTWMYIYKVLREEQRTVARRECQFVLRLQRSGRQGAGGMGHRFAEGDSC